MKLKMYVKRLWGLILTVLGFTTGLYAQIITTQPTVPTENDEITITYDATQGTTGLVGATKVYMHAGAVFESQTSAKWENVVGNWGRDDGLGAMTSLGNNRWQIKISPRTYFKATTAQKIYRIGMVFRNADGSKEGKSATGGDIFLDLGFAMNLSSPNLANNYLFVPANQAITVTGTTTLAATVTVQLNGTQVANFNNVTTFTHNITPQGTGQAVVTVTATAGTEIRTNRFTYVVTETPQQAALPAGVQDGINYLNDNSAVLVLFAPQKSFVYAVGEFNNWTFNSNSLMRRTPDGNRYWLQINNLAPRQEYAFQYVVDGEVWTTDPYTEKVLDPNNDAFIPATTYPNLKAYPRNNANGMVGILQTAKAPYNWKVKDFQRPEKRDMVVYELLFRDFTTEGTIKAAMDRLDYLKELGVNVIELMPVNEFSGNDSWGYNPIFYFAPDKAYGTDTDLKNFIDRCHELGMAVVLDMVLNQADYECPLVRMYWDRQRSRPAANSPYHNAEATHPFNVFFDFNHESDATKYFVKRVNEYWIKEYNIDGYRFDLSKGFTQKKTVGLPNEVGEWSKYDAVRVATWKRIADEIWAINNSIYVILEHLGENNEEKELGEYKTGMIFWGNINGNFKNATTGRSNSDLAWTYYGARGWNQAGVLAYMESHDEERLMYNNLNFGLDGANGYNTRDLATALTRMKQAAAFFFAIPGAKMIWQFGELGYDFSINYCQDGTIKNDCRVGRKPVRWDYFNDARRKSLYDFYKTMTRLKLTQPAFRTTDVSQVVQNLGGSIKTLTINHSAMRVFMIGNFGTNSADIDLNVPTTGTWYDYFTGESVDLPSFAERFTLPAGSFYLLTSVQLPKPSIEGLSPFKLQRFVKEPPLSTLDEQFNQSITVYPNPSQTGRYELQFNTPTKRLNVIVRDVTGRLLKEEWVEHGVEKHTLDLQNLTQGLYLVEIEDGNRKAVKRIFKQ